MQIFCHVKILTSNRLDTPLVTVCIGGLFFKTDTSLVSHHMSSVHQDLDKTFCKYDT